MEKQLIVPELAQYLFGAEYRVDIANDTLLGHPNIENEVKQLHRCIEECTPHFGISLIAYLDLDTGLFFCALQSNPNFPSIASFYISSNHRYFGGQSLVCIPLPYLTPFISFEGEYIVYRHTFKRPIISTEKYDSVMKNGGDQEKMKLMLLCKSRDGYETIPGKSYVGLSKRSWQERYVEHIDKSLKENGASRFHEAMRDTQGQNVICVHDVSLFGATKDRAIEYEKHLIRESTIYPKGLNMKVG